ncbi:uridine kinase [Catalinimonas alkaloidigena]|uniref:uridine kinase family protein n=1 Tax=Catalinimonas alkaloidigena TaxID=1075417 RepID=UPI00240517E0|nr:uridine kinase [Catalinimonas alkaloidigena]MDF9800203.1 uridine kinase [Catalinimonas alkaloidigena]
MERPYVVGISGGSGSGKTQVLSWLQGEVEEENICMFSQDNYYYEKLISSPKEAKAFNFDDPEVIDVQQFARDLGLLKEGRTVYRRDYVFNELDKEGELLAFSPAPIIVVEGIFIFHYSEIWEQLDLKVFVEVKEHLKFQRRINRDMKERGYHLDDILYKYTKQVVPAYEQYIEPYRHLADVIIPNNQAYSKQACPTAVQLLGTFLKSKIK